MFDVSFSELIVIAIVALIVIGPEKLPKVARMLGAIAGRLQRYVAQIKEEVNRDVRFQELQQLQQEIQEAVIKTKVGIESDLQSNINKASLELGKFKLEEANLKVQTEIVTNKKLKVIKPRPIKSPINKNH